MAETIEAAAPARRKRGKSPTARSLEFLRKSGDPAVVEKHSSFGGKFGKKHDLWGYLDILSLPYDGSGIIGVQTTSGSNVAARRSKILGITPAGATDKEKAEAARIRARAILFLQNGGKLFLHGWAMRGPRGAAKRWTVTVEEVTLEVLAVSPSLEHTEASAQEELF